MLFSFQDDNTRRLPWTQSRRLIGTLQPIVERKALEARNFQEAVGRDHHAYVDGRGAQCINGGAQKLVPPFTPAESDIALGWLSSREQRFPQPTKKTVIRRQVVRDSIGSKSKAHHRPGSRELAERPIRAGVIEGLQDHPDEPSRSAEPLRDARRRVNDQSSRFYEVRVDPWNVGMLPRTR